MQRITLTALMKIELADHTVLLCDGGTVTWSGDTYTSRDSIYGVLDRVDTIAEGVGDQAPAFQLSFLPDPDASAFDLTDPALQDSRLRMWSAEIDEDDGTVSGTPQLEADAEVDVPRLRFPASGRVLENDCVSVWQVLLDRNQGNVLNGTFHKSIHAGELGLDNATGVSTSVAWGTTGPPRGLGGGVRGGGGTPFPIIEDRL